MNQISRFDSTISVPGPGLTLGACVVHKATPRANFSHYAHNGVGDWYRRSSFHLSIDRAPSICAVPEHRPPRSALPQDNQISVGLG